MATSQQWQLERSAAQRYRKILEPAILGPFAEALVAWVSPEPRSVVLDVGCGTGAAALAARRLLGENGRVIGVDVNQAMVELARERDASIEWREASAESLPISNGSVDVVVCAQTPQFLRARDAAAEQVARVLRAGGRAAISIWAPLAENPYFAALVGAVSRHIGAEVASGSEAAFRFTDAGGVVTLLRACGLSKATASESELQLDLPPLAEFVPRHISATLMGPGFAAAPDSARERVVADVLTALASTAAAPKLVFRARFILGEP